MTFQWTEFVARLRANQIDMGEWNRWGTLPRIAELLSALGLEGRAPRKEDYRYNFAISGAECQELTEGRTRQAQRLVYLMDPLIGFFD